MYLVVYVVVVASQGFAVRGGGYIPATGLRPLPEERIGSGVEETHLELMSSSER